MKRRINVFALTLVLAISLLLAREPVMTILRSGFLSDKLAAIVRSPATRYLYKLHLLLSISDPEIALYRKQCRSSTSLEKFKALYTFKEKKAACRITSVKEIFKGGPGSSLKLLFRHRGKIFLIRREGSGFDLKYYLGILREKGIEKIKQVRFLYLNSDGKQLVTIRTRQPAAVLLNENLQEKRLIPLRETLLREVIPFHNKIYVHRKRLCQAEAAVDIYEDGKLKASLFHLHQSISPSTFEIAVADDTVFAPGKKRLYITYSYPLSSILQIYTFTPDGKPAEVWQLETGKDYQLPSGLLEQDKFLDSLEKANLLGVNGIYEGEGKVYVAVGYRQGGRGQDYLYVLDPESRSYFKISLPYGSVVFYDREEGYFYSLKLRGSSEEIYRWRLKLR